MSLWRAFLVIVLTHSYCRESWACVVNQKGKTTLVKAKAAELNRIDVARHPIQGFPNLMDITLEQLEDGLARRRFSSVDLVKVGQPS
jgi:hypothetical protein